jgi:ADP-ribosylglycohydrolase
VNRAEPRDWPRPEQFSGCLLGQCLGDALGFPVEGYPRSACTRYVDTELRPRALAAGRGRSPFGQYSDDSQLARELMRSYADRESFDPEDYARRIAALFAEGRVVGGGRATGEAAHRLSLGVSWREAGTPPPAAGNGSAMRAAPIGLFFHDDPDALIRHAHEQGWITHQDPRCSAGAVAVAGAVSLALQPAPINAGIFLRTLAAWVSEVESGFARELLRIEGWLEAEADAVIAEIADSGLDPGFRDGWEGITPYVVGSVLWSLYSFLRSPDDYWETICTAILIGGDVDTTAAMAGAISGARLGLPALPEALLDKLHDRGSWRYADLVTLAERCFAARFRERAPARLRLGSDGPDPPPGGGSADPRGDLRRG